TGQSLGNLWSRQAKWEDSAKIIGDLYAEKPSDELLISFLSGHQASENSNRETSMALAAKISDETKRAEVIARIEGKAVRTTVISE
ncbi:MAG TPA: hypothetical protein VGE67_08945, partial [Haloferula sp.]